MKTLTLLFILFSLSLSGTANGATELGEYCFSGAFHKEGNCTIRLDVTQHTHNYSLNGVVDCDIQTDDGVSGVATGSGYIQGNTFIGSFIIPHEWGQAGVSFSEVAAHGMTFTANLSEFTARVRKRTESAEVCGPGFLPICIEEVVFAPTACS